METTGSRSTLEILPDEILLEICNYMLCVDILQSFVGLNSRMTRMITKYRHYVSLHKVTFVQASYLYMNVLPQIGYHIRSLLIDCCYAVLQDDLFIKQFGDKMSIMFPHLEKLCLVMFQSDRLTTFLETLHDLNYLFELHLYELFEINNDQDQESTVLLKLMQANNYRLRTILIDNASSTLSFNRSACFVNILRLRINIRTVTDLPFLFTAVPNLQYLDVTIRMSDEETVDFYKMIISPLIYLVDFQFKSTARRWILEELPVILLGLPVVKRISLFLSTDDARLVQRNTLLSLFSSTVQQFHYAVYYMYDMQPNQDEAIVVSWSLSQPVICIANNNFSLIHTLPWQFTRASFLQPTAKMLSNQANGYDKRIEILEVFVSRNFTLSKSLAIISQCHRVKEIKFWMDNGGDPVQGMCVL
jgi:hypothetical protein